jgi:hypothetical protein
MFIKIALSAAIVLGAAVVMKPATAKTIENRRATSPLRMLSSPQIIAHRAIKYQSRMSTSARLCFTAGIRTMPMVRPCAS